MGVAFLHGVSTNQTIEAATAIASNHPSLAHILANGAGSNSGGYAAPNAGILFKRDLERVGSASSANESLFKTEMDISALNTTDLEIPIVNESLFKTSVTLNPTLNRSSTLPSTNKSDENRQLPAPGSKSSNRSKRDDRSSHNWSQRSERRKYRKRPTSVQYDWSSYMASLKSFPYLSSKLFPKITYCDFTVRQMTTFQLFTTQCVLSINFINEKVSPVSIHCHWSKRGQWVELRMGSR